MRLLLAFTAASAVVLATGTLLPPGHTGSSKPTLQLVDRQPLKLRGAFFKPRERVRVTAETALARETRTVRASSTGSFVVRFDRVRLDPCGLEATAWGARGSRAVYKLAALSERACPVP